MRHYLCLIPALSAAMSVGIGCQPAETTPRQHVSILRLFHRAEADLSPDLLQLARTDHVTLLKNALASYDSLGVKDYTCRFVKQEKMRGQLGKEQDIAVKFRREPFSVAMTWMKNPPPGDALVYVEGLYKNDKGRSQMVVRPQKAFQWLVGQSVLRLPDGPDAMRSGLRPCTMFGFRNGLENLLKVYEQALAAKECQMSYAGLTGIDGRTCLVLSRVLPPGKGYPAWVTETCLDAKTLLPLRLVGYDWDGNLSSNYEYHDVKFNVGLKDKDFTPQANQIAPPKMPKTK